MKRQQNQKKPKELKMTGEFGFFSDTMEKSILSILQSGFVDTK